MTENILVIIIGNNNWKPIIGNSRSKHTYYTSKYRLNTENGGFTPDKSRGPKARGIYLA